MDSPSLFLSDRLSDIKLKIIGSDGPDHSLVIPAHWTILIQNSHYFEGKYNFLIGGGIADMVISNSTLALIVDVSEIGTVQEVLDILALFYSNVGTMPDKEERFKNLNSDILDKFRIKDVEYVYPNIFENIEFFIDPYSRIIRGSLKGKDFLELSFYKTDFYIKFLAYNEFVEDLKNYLQDNEIIYEINIDPAAQTAIKYHLFNEISIDTINISLIDNINVKILFDKIKEKSTEEVINRIDKIIYSQV